MPASDDRDTVRIKIKGTEFEATGDKASVDARFSAFMALAERLVNAPDLDGDEPEARDRKPVDKGKPVDTDVDALYKRAFRVDGDVLSLNALPPGDEQRLDTIILILYGRSKLMGETTTLIAYLLDGLAKTGLTIPAVAKTIDSKYVTKVGVKRGSRYSLTNPGIQRAEDLLRKQYV